MKSAILRSRPTSLPSGILRCFSHHLMLRRDLHLSSRLLDFSAPVPRSTSFILHIIVVIVVPRPHDLESTVALGPPTLRVVLRLGAALGEAHLRTYLTYHPENLA